VNNLVKTTVETFGTIEVAVNNAGVNHSADFFDITPDDWDWVLSVDLKGTFLVTQAAARVMVEQKKQAGYIIDDSPVQWHNVGTVETCNREKLPTMETTEPTTFKVFITGATTDVGRELTRQLTRRGHRVTGQTSGMAGAVQLRADGGLPAFSDPLRPGELKSMIQVAQADVVIHALPMIANDFPRKETPWDYAERAFTEGVPMLLEAATALDVKYVLLLAPAYIYGDQGAAGVTENADSFAGPLADSVLAAEQAVLDSAIPGSVLRLGMVYGPDGAGTHTLADHIRFGRSVYQGDGLLSWVYAADAAAAAVLAVEQQPVDEIFNIASDTASGAEFAGLLAEQVGLPVPGAFNGLMALPRTSAHQRDLLNMTLRVNCDKAQAVLGWSPKFDLRKGLDHTLLAWRVGEPARA
jgi:nucleoside-diphosphate-sugar epimerase